MLFAARIFAFHHRDDGFCCIWWLLQAKSVCPPSVGREMAAEMQAILKNPHTNPDKSELIFPHLLSFQEQQEPICYHARHN
nr:hypothetical protein [uncultured Cohaesibacter sp.]